MIFFNIAAYGQMLIAVMHFAVSIMHFRTLDEEFLWFSGASLVLFFNSILNLVVCKAIPQTRTALILTEACNLIVLIYGILAVIIIGEIQTYVIVLFSLMLCLAWIPAFRNLNPESDPE